VKHSGRVVVTVAHAGQIEAAAKRSSAPSSAIDLWIDNAMVSVFSPASQMTSESRAVTAVTWARSGEPWRRFEG
jgi:hypothetical protein